MKHFIYMDTEILNSYISQFNDGLITNTHSEVTDYASSGKTESNSDPTATTSVKFSLPPIFNIGIDKKDELSSSTNVLTQSQSGRELIDKLFHDNAFNLFIKYLKDNSKLKLDNYSINDYVSITGTFEFWDLDYLFNLFSDNLINFLVETQTENYKKMIFNQSGKMPNNSAIKNYEKEEKDSSKQIKNIIEICRDMMPFSKFMMINNCFVPLRDEFMRESIKSIRFKYTGKITLIGMYTNDYKGVTQQGECTNFSQVFGSLDGLVNAFLKESLNMPEYSKVITPIALYFE